MEANTHEEPVLGPEDADVTWLQTSPPHSLGSESSPPAGPGNRVAREVQPDADRPYSRTHPEDHLKWEDREGGLLVADVTTSPTTITDPHEEPAL